jgi:hypothetical protein
MQRGKIQNLPYTKNKVPKLPLNASGFFTNEAMIRLDEEEARNDRNFGFGNLIRDLGLKRARGGNGKLGTAFTGDFSNSIGALGEGFRSATNNAVDRGFSSRGAMRNIAFEPIRRTIFDKADSANVERLRQNQADRNRRNQLLFQAAREAAQYGFENRQPKEMR